MVTGRGFGTYRFGGEVAMEQQLALDHRRRGATHSLRQRGRRRGQNYPRIDVLISINGAYCYDTLIDVHAAPRKKLRQHSISTP